MSFNRTTAAYGVLTVVLGVVMTFFIPNRIDQEGLDFIKKHEAFVPTPYRDQGGVWTQGYGFTYLLDGTPVTEHSKYISRQQADYMLGHLIREYEWSIHANVKKSLTQSQYNALCSFAWNVGIPAFERSTLLKEINKDPNSPKIVTNFYKWVYVKGRISKGLVYRREQEIELYFSDPYIFAEEPQTVSYFRPDTIPL